MRSPDPYRLSLWITMGLAVLLAFLVYDAERLQNTVSSDGRGYFAYLPSLHKNHDLGFAYPASVEKQRYAPGYAADYLVPAGHDTVNKYFPGTALLMAPFYTAGAVAGKMADGWADPYGIYCQAAILAGAMVYLFMGLVLFARLLRHLFPLCKPVFVLVPLLLFGTSLFQYSVIQPSMSHVYSFFAINWFLWQALQVALHRKLRHVIMASFALGLVFLIRPTNLVVMIAVPFLLGKAETKATLKWLTQYTVRPVVAMLTFSLAVLLLLVVYRMQCGTWFTWSYSGEGFYFTRPEIANVLFSFRKGLFIYTPLLILTIAGAIYLFKHDRFRAIFLFLFLIVSTYLIASWWNWYYGDSFGHRAFVDTYGIWLLGAAYLFNSRLLIRWPVTVIAMVAAGLTAFQNWQYHHGILHKSEMTPEKYKTIFLKTDSEYRNALQGNRDNRPYGTSAPVEIHSFSGNVVNTKGNEFPAGTEIHSAQLKGHSRLYIEAEVVYTELSEGAAAELYLVSDIWNDHDQSVLYRSFPVKEIRVLNDRKTHTSRSSWVYNRLPADAARLKVYLWNKDKKELQATLKVRVEGIGQ